MNSPDTDYLSAVRAVFASHETELGRPEAPTKEGFLALARAGCEVWNAWRTNWPDPLPDFGGFDFVREPIDFRGFRFGVRASVENNLQYDVPHTIFSDAIFGELSTFVGAEFGFRVTFENAKFVGMASFVGAQFGDVADFRGAQFEKNVSFSGAQFGHCTNFTGARFKEAVSFAGVQFGTATRFSGAEFNGYSIFVGWDERRSAHVWQLSCMNEAAIRRRIEYSQQWNLRSDAFLDITFAGALFTGRVSFQDREFKGTTDFGPLKADIASHEREGHKIPKGQQTLFKDVPNFHGCSSTTLSFWCPPALRPRALSGRSSWQWHNNKPFEKSSVSFASK